MDLQHLSHLIYSPPVLFDDLVNFLHKPSLTSLDLLGDVESAASLRDNDALSALLTGALPNAPPPQHGLPAEGVANLTTISPNLRRVWTPSTSYSAIQLEQLFENSALDEFALVMDVLSVDLSQWLEEELTQPELIKREQAFIDIFGKIGKSLKALSISSRKLPASFGAQNVQITFGVGPMGGGGGGGPAGGGPLPGANRMGGRANQAGGAGPIFFGMGGGAIGGGAVGGGPMGGFGAMGGGKFDILLFDIRTDSDIPLIRNGNGRIGSSIRCRRWCWSRATGSSGKWDTASTTLGFLR